jgi:hypothetical protein
MWLILGLKRASNCAYAFQVSAEAAISSKHPPNAAVNPGRDRQFIGGRVHFHHAT